MIANRDWRGRLATVAALAGLGLLMAAAVAFAVTGYGAAAPTADDIPRIATNRALEAPALDVPSAEPTSTAGDDSEESDEDSDGPEKGKREVVKPKVRDEEHDDDDADGESSPKEPKKKR